MINQMKGEYICEFGDRGPKKKKRREKISIISLLFDKIK